MFIYSGQYCFIWYHPQDYLDITFFHLGIVQWMSLKDKDSL